MFVKLGNFWINANKITAVSPCFDGRRGTQVFCSSADVPFYVDANVDDVINKIFDFYRR